MVRLADGPKLLAAALAAGLLVPLSVYPADGGQEARGESSAPPRHIAVARESELIQMVRHDCGSCHGLSLAGGLGPPLTPAALSDKSVEYVQAMILRGRKGTAMPAWQGLLQDDEALWIAQALKAGLSHPR